jgi:hypothetical protein
VFRDAQEITNPHHSAFCSPVSLSAMRREAFAGLSLGSFDRWLTGGRDGHRKNSRLFSSMATISDKPGRSVDAYASASSCVFAAAA